MTTFRTVSALGLDVFYREAGDPGSPKLLLLDLRDLPKVTLVRLDSGHFAVEDCLEAIAQGIRDSYDQQVRADHA